MTTPPPGNSDPGGPTIRGRLFRDDPPGAGDDTLRPPPAGIRRPGGSGPSTLPLPPVPPTPPPGPPQRSRKRGNWALAAVTVAALAAGTGLYVFIFVPHHPVSNETQVAPSVTMSQPVATSAEPTPSDSASSAPAAAPTSAPASPTHTASATPSATPTPSVSPSTVPAPADLQLRCGDGEDSPCGNLYGQVNLTESHSIQDQRTATCNPDHTDDTDLFTLSGPVLSGNGKAVLGLKPKNGHVAIGWYQAYTVDDNGEVIDRFDLRGKDSFEFRLKGVRTIAVYGNTTSAKPGLGIDDQHPILDSAHNDQGGNSQGDNGGGRDGGDSQGDNGGWW